MHFLLYVLNKASSYSQGHKAVMQQNKGPQSKAKFPMGIFTSQFLKTSKAF